MLSKVIASRAPVRGGNGGSKVSRARGDRQPDPQGGSRRSAAAWCSRSSPPRATPRAPAGEDQIETVKGYLGPGRERGHRDRVAGRRLLTLLLRRGRRARGVPAADIEGGRRRLRDGSGHRLSPPSSSQSGSGKGEDRAWKRSRGRFEMVVSPETKAVARRDPTR
ncbi:hypothetical protein QJS66_02890 [Kocuria rhizophila]|nr:hypothetical protein QJS66_02890 [Kocuria rhizophila]